MSMKKKIIINHIAKTEGHASFEGALYEGRMKEAKYFSEEGARLIEALLVGHYYEDAPIITARICGVCPVVHSTCSIKALEAAFGIKVHPDVNIARTLMMFGEFLTSHVFHSFFFSLPDLLNFSNDFDMMEKYPKETKAAMFIRVYSAELIDLFGGRPVHPIACQVGGFKVWPEKKKIEELYDKYPEALESIRILLLFFVKIKYPILKRECEYISLRSDNEYALCNGDIVSTQGLNVSAKKFANSVEEIQRQREVVKHTSFKGKSYFVGSLARINNNYSQLQKESKKAWKLLCENNITTNSFMNIYAQVVEMLDCVLVSGKLLKQMIDIKPIPPEDVKVRASTGIGAVEAPRGTLLHYYKLDKDGIILENNIITPTAQFLSNIEEDIIFDGPILAKLSDKDRKHRIKTLIRAYDPCISCATH